MIYLCATPIGNLEDITLRVLRILKEVDLVAAEDTRQAKKLLTHYDIRVPVISLHQHNEAQRTEEILAWAAEGKDVAVVSDAGMPGISDPGGRLTRAAAAAGADITVLPGANAALTGLVLSGLPCETFYFGGFLPRRSSERKKALEAVRSLQASLVYYEAPHRLLKTLTDMTAVLGDRQAAVARELTKWYEETLRGPLTGLLDHFGQTPPRGELVIVVEGGDLSEEPMAANTDIRRAVLDEMDAGASKKEAIKNVARRSGLSKNEVYQRVLDLPTQL